MQTDTEFIAARFISCLRLTLSQRDKLLLGSASVKPETAFGALLAKAPSLDQDAIHERLGKGIMAFTTEPPLSYGLYDTLVTQLQEGDTFCPDPTQLYFNDSIKCPISELRLMVNVLNIKKSVLFDPINNLVFPYDFELIHQNLKTLLGKEGYPAWLSTNAEQREFTYVPNTKEPSRAFTDKKGHHAFNLWTEASWRKDWVPDPSATLPVEVEEFMSVLVVQEDRKHVLAWLRDCTFSKAEPILVLCGVPGVGKNVFVNNLAGGLVGGHNRREAARSFKSSSFHSSVAQCRLFLLDEAELDPLSREILKSYHNGTAAIERKGVDVGDPEPIYASFVLANNHRHKIKLEYTDRKFYTPQLCTKNLKDLWSQEKIDTFLDLLTQDPYLQQIASYLKFNFKADSARRFPKNAFFESVCLNSAPPFFRKFYHLCQHKAEFSSEDFNRGSRSKQDAFQLKDEVDLYSSQRGKPLADVTILADSRWIAKSHISVETPEAQDILIGGAN